MGTMNVNAAPARPAVSAADTGASASRLAERLRPPAPAAKARTDSSARAHSSFDDNLHV